MRMPLGYMQAKGSGYFHSLLIDSLEHLEYPLSVLSRYFSALIGGKRMVKHSNEVITHIPSEMF